MNLNEIAVSVAESMPDFLWREGDTHEGGVLDSQAVEFARRLLAEVQKRQEPVAWICREDGAIWAEKSFDHDIPLYKALEIAI